MKRTPVLVVTADYPVASLLDVLDAQVGILGEPDDAIPHPLVIEMTQGLFPVVFVLGTGDNGCVIQPPDNLNRRGIIELCGS